MYKKNYQFHWTHSLGQTCLHYKNGNAEHSVLWFRLWYYKGKEDLNVSKTCLNLCSRRWLQLNRNLVNNLTRTDSHLWYWLVLTYILMRIKIILLVGTLWINLKKKQKKKILHFFVRLFIYSHKSNIKMFWYYSPNILIRLSKSKVDRWNIC